MYLRSAYQIDYSPDSLLSGYRLLSLGDILTADISRQYSTRTQTSDIIGADWTHHQARGNATLSLSWESLVTFTSCSESERVLTLHLQTLLAARQGTLRLASAFVGDTATLVQDWTATLETVTHRVLAATENPLITTPSSFGRERTWAAVSYQYTLTNPITR